MKRLLIALALLAALAAEAAADFKTGLWAYLRADYAIAFEEFTAEAGEGNPVAQFNLGHMYANGEGIAKDEAEAVKWYR
ncbi:MAG: sel1 repeat family protein, partial [Proteobacteria bacterium]|nr:sel1 repeat family protein [Pseudomonadota bacterium]